MLFLALLTTKPAEQDRLRKDLVSTWQTLTQREAFLQELLQKEQVERDKVEQKNFILLQALEVLGAPPANATAAPTTTNGNGNGGSNANTMASSPSLAGFSLGSNSSLNSSSSQRLNLSLNATGTGNGTKQFTAQMSPKSKLLVEGQQQQSAELAAENQVLYCVETEMRQ